LIENYDVIIVGGAAAGLTAAIYTSRRRLNTLILTKDLGGQAILTRHVCNYPGFLDVTGADLMKRFEKQAKGSGAEIIFDEVTQITQDGADYLVKTATKQFKARAVILAFGKTPRSLNVPGEDRFYGKGVSYCATCDAPLYKSKTVAIVGGGNSALDATILLSGVVNRVYLIHRRDEFRGFESFVEEVSGKKNVELVLSSVIAEIKGDTAVRSIIVKNLKTNQAREIAVDGIFVEIGYDVNPDMIKGLVKLDEYNQVVINEKCQTFYPDKNEIRPGIFAAGDVTNILFKQIVVAAGEGAKAGLEVYNYIHGVKDSQIIADWSKK
jgi:thioredoxin reductase (NADPH)